MGAVYLYRFNFFTGFIVASSVYYLLCRVKPVPATSRVWCEKPDEPDRQFSVVYTEGEPYDEERSGGIGGDSPPAAHYGAGGEEKTAAYVDKMHEPRY